MIAILQHMVQSELHKEYVNFELSQHTEINKLEDFYIS